MKKLVADIFEKRYGGGLRGCRKCGQCCGPWYCSPSEWKRIQEYSRKRGITDPGKLSLADACPYFKTETGCLIYPVRPLVCRMFGRVPGLKCPHNAGRKKLSKAVVAEVKRLYDQEMMRGAEE